jgi:hypothetical protein
MSFRHTADIYRPTEALNTRGGQEGQPVLLVGDWPCEVTPTGGTEVEQAGGTFADATYEVAGRHPGIEVKPRDYLLWNKRRLEISSIVEPQRLGSPMVLTCGGAA